MKTHRLVCLCLSSAFLLAGCSLSNIVSPGASEDYYRIDLYTDYDGIDADKENKALDASKARYVGYCFAKKGMAMNIDGLQVAEGAAQYTKSTRTAPKGYHYTFTDWVGFYEDGTAIDKTKVNANCNLFADFDALKNTYVVTLMNVYQEVFAAAFDYQTKLGDTDKALTSDAYNHDPENRGGDPYYLNYEFDGYRVETFDQDGNSLSTKNVENYTALNELIIEDDTEITVKYKGTTEGGEFKEGLKKSFTVTLSPFAENGDPLTFDSTKTSFSKAVVYDEAFSASDITETVAGKQFLRFEGSYGDSAPAALRGKAFDPSHVRYDIEIKAIYGDVKKTKQVNFHDKAEPTVITFEEGDIVSFPMNNVEVGTGYSFAGFYVTEADSLDAFDKDTLFTLPGDTLDLYPAKVPTRLVDHVGEKYFYYRYDASEQGYVLENFAVQTDSSTLSTAKTLVFLSADDFLNADRTPAFSAAGYASYDKLYAKFPLVAIESFKSSRPAGAPGNSSDRVGAIALPTSVKKILDSGFDGLTKLYYEEGTKTLDLSTTSIKSIGNYAFKGNINVESVILPNGIEAVGAYAFKDCERVASIHVPSGKGENSFTQYWNYSKPGESGRIPVIED